MLQLDQIYMYGGRRQKSDNMGQRFFTTPIISHMAKLLEKFDTGLQHCPCVDKVSSQLDCCWTSVQHISDKTACWNIRPNIWLILPCFTAHQAHTPPPAGRAGTPSDRWTRQEEGEGARLLVPPNVAAANHLRCFHFTFVQGHYNSRSVP